MLLAQAIVAAAESDGPPLTVLEFGDGTLASALAAPDDDRCRGGPSLLRGGIEEIVVIGEGGRSKAGSSELPSGATAWANSCKAPSQMLALVRALLKAGRLRVAVALTAAAAATPTTQLRILQLCFCLRDAGLLLALLVLEEPRPPATTDRAMAKAVLQAPSRGAQTSAKLLTCAMLPREASSRRRAWRAFLSESLQGAGASVEELIDDASGVVTLLVRGLGVTAPSSLTPAATD